MPTRMRPLGHTIPLAEARQIVERTIRPLERVERVALLEAHGRILARAAVATADVPPFARAAMDGYAVHADDTAGASRTRPRLVRRIDQVFTGEVARQTVAPGTCIEIATGAPVPDGADAVVIVEDTDIDADGTVRLFASVTRGQNIGRRGADIEAGTPVLAEGALLNPSRIGVLAALGLTEVDVHARPRVAILSTGNELVDPGGHLAPGQIYDVNKFTLAAVVAEHGGVPVIYRSAVDTLEDLTRALDECLAEDVLVFSGGSSVGERDLILDIIAARGEVLFHGIAVKPGKPTAFGLIAGKPVFGMPGSPASCLTNGYVLLAPALRRMGRAPAADVRRVAVPLGRRISSTPGRLQFYTVRIENGTAVPAFKSSGDITSMSRADGYIEIPADTEAVEEGTVVDVTLF